MADVGIERLIGDVSVEGLRAGAMEMAVWIFWGVIILGFLAFAYMKYMDKKVYKYPVRIFRRRNNGLVRETNTFGGYVKNAKLTYFMIKMGKFKKKKLNKIPLSELMDEDNRIYFWQVSPDAPLIQTKRSFVIEKVMAQNENYKEPTLEEYDKLINEKIIELKKEEYYKETDEDEVKKIARQIINEKIENERNELIDVTIPTYTPIPSDIQQQAMMDIANYRNTLGVDVNKQFAYFIMGVIAIIILGIIIFYIAMNKGDIPIITQLIPLMFFKRKKRNK